MGGFYYLKLSCCVGVPFRMWNIWNAWNVLEHLHRSPLDRNS